MWFIWWQTFRLGTCYSRLWLASSASEVFLTYWRHIEQIIIITSAKEVMFLPVFVCLSVCLSVCLCACQKNNSESYGRIFLKFWVNVGHGINYKWLNFGGDLAGILDSGLLWNFRYHCVKGGIREPLKKRIWWHHLANNIALAEVPAGYDCFLVNVK